MKQYKVITLCGSTRFKDEFQEVQKRLTLEGNIVISVGLFGHSGDSEVWTEGTKAMLDDMHKRKIDMADEIFVINVGGYIGSSTKGEIEYAKSQGKAVRYYTDETTGFVPSIPNELIQKFYRSSLFRNGKDAASVAYRDFCRTLKVNENGDECKKMICSRLIKWVDSLDIVTSQEAYDTKHREICMQIIQVYQDNGMEMHFGQAQKWINMFMKYLCILGYTPACRHIPFLHIPVDNVILKAAKKQFGIVPKSKSCWSKFDEDTYLDFQLQMRESLKGETAIIWEFKAWNDQDANGA